MSGKLLAKLMLVAGLVIGTPSLAFAEEGFSPYVDADGNISLPGDIQTNMAHLGAWFVPTGGASGFHDVYTQKSSIVFYQEHGRFPDGAVLVKELRGANVGNYTTGEGVHHSTSEIKQWFVMVKDEQSRFGDNPLWGDGWGWALFKPDNTEMNLAKDYKTDCLGCHLPVKDKDWVYTEAYPVLFK
ncbi:MAG: cytochrome P460 family protein [Halioglobus sp.]